MYKGKEEEMMKISKLETLAVVHTHTHTHTYNLKTRRKDNYIRDG